MCLTARLQVLPAERRRRPQPGRQPVRAEEEEECRGQLLGEGRHAVPAPAQGGQGAGRAPHRNQVREGESIDLQLSSFDL